MCTFQLQLSKGAITAQGILPQQARHTPVAVTGATGPTTARAGPSWSPT